MHAGQGRVQAGGHAASQKPSDRPSVGARSHGLVHPGPVHWDLAVPRLVEMAVAREEGFLAPGGALVVRTDPYTGRSPKDKFTVEEPSTREKIWWGPVNRPFEAAKFDHLLERVRAYLQGKELFVFNGWVCADENYRMPIRVVTERAWHSLFARTLFLRPAAEELSSHRPEFTIINACGLRAIPEVDGTRSEAFIIVSYEKRIVLIGGTCYAGEMKKSIFSILNFLLPEKGVFPMHCSANMTATERPPSSSASPERGRRLSQRTRTGASLVTTSTAGPTRGSSTSRGVLRQDHPPLPGGGTSDLQRHPFRVSPGECHRESRDPDFGLRR